MLSKTISWAAAAAIAVVLASAPTLVAADPYAITYTGIQANSNSQDFVNGESYSLTFVFDNGSSTAASQTWNGADLRCAIWSFNTARNVIYRQDLSANQPGTIIASASTDSSGNLTANFSEISDISVRNGFIYNGTEESPFSWFANDANEVFYARGFSAQVADSSVGVQMAPSNWSNPTPFTSSCLATGPTITALTPANGSSNGGTSVVITGTQFTGATSVTFGANPAASFVVNSATQITAVAPAGAPSSVVRVTVTTPNGLSADTSADDFTYSAPAPIPTMSEWAMILFGMILAGAAALFIQRRRLVA